MDFDLWMTVPSKPGFGLVATAASFGNMAMLRRLVALGADLNITPSGPMVGGTPRRPVDLARRGRHHEVRFSNAHTVCVAVSA